MERAKLHKAIIILVRAEGAKSAKYKAIDLIENTLINNGSGFDWYQGIKESERWPEYEKYDFPLNADLVKNEINDFLKTTIKEVHGWIDRGLRELKKKGDHRLGWTACNFSIAGSNTTAFIFDNDGEGIKDQEHLDNVLTNWSKPTKQTLFAAWFDIHH